MAPSISAISTFSSQAPVSVTGTNTAQPSPNPDPNPDHTDQGQEQLKIRPLDMIISDDEVYDELDRRIDEMRGWLDAVGAGLDDLLQPLEFREVSDTLVA